MAKFVASERDRAQPCFVYEEELDLIVELMAPANLEHARKVADFLNANVREIKFNPDTADDNRIG
jgi:hypothetical protein